MTDERKYDDPDIQKFAEENREMIEKLLAEEKARQAKIEAEERARAEAEYIAKRNAQQRYEDAMARECGVGHLAATDVADYLAKHGLPFREAHAVVGHLVLMCEKRGCNLEDLPFEVFQEASPLFERDITEALDIPSIVAARTTEGGTAPAAVAVQLDRAEAQLVADEGVFGSLTKVVEMGHGVK